MKRKAKSQATHSGLAVVNPNAAAIDIGATMHVAAVGADRASDPVRSFGLSLLICTGWLLVCGMRGQDGRHGIDQRLLDPIFELLDERALR